jgi:hypothetical protein
MAIVVTGQEQPGAGIPLRRYLRVPRASLGFGRPPPTMLIPQLPLSLVLLTFSLVWPSLQKSTLGERKLQELSVGSISTLVSSPDPVTNIDLDNPNSHLNKILIPRARECCTYG